MRTWVSLFCAAVLLIGGMALVGCESADEPSPNDTAVAPTTSPSDQPVMTPEENRFLGNDDSGDFQP